MILREEEIRKCNSDVMEDSGIACDETIVDEIFKVTIANDFMC